MKCRYVLVRQKTEEWDEIDKSLKSNLTKIKDNAAINSQLEKDKTKFLRNFLELEIFWKGLVISKSQWYREIGSL